MTRSTPLLLRTGSGLAAVMCLTALVACSKPPKPAEEVRPVRTLVIAPTATRLMNTYAGEVRARYESALGFRVAGKISARKVDVGSHVRKGEVLFTLDGNDLSLGAASARAQVAQAQAQFKSAQLDLARYKDLQGRGFVSKSEFDRQQALFDSAQAQLAAITAQSAQMQNQTGYASLTADADGVVTAVLAEAGQMAAAGAPVVRVARDGELEVATTIPEDQIGRVKEGMPVTVSLWIAGKAETEGRIREVASVADSYTRTYPIRVSIAKAPANMRMGMTASVNIPLATPPLIHVPASAMILQGKRAGVWVLEPASLTARFRPIAYLGAEGGDLLIASGLAPGDEVITAGAPFLFEGRKVKRLLQAAVPPANAAPKTASPAKAG